MNSSIDKRYSDLLRRYALRSYNENQMLLEILSKNNLEEMQLFLEHLDNYNSPDAGEYSGLEYTINGQPLIQHATSDEMKALLKKHGSPDYKPPSKKGGSRKLHRRKRKSVRRRRY